jgi:hypothetical protein
MANVTITQLPQAGAITGQELVPVVQNGQTVQTTTAAISASPSQNQTFLTVNQEATLINSRALSGGTGIGLTDGGALSTLQINLNAVSGSLESSGVGLIAKTGGTVTGRTLVAGTSGLSITNGNGVSGNPSISLTGALAGIPGLAGTGLISIIGGSTASQVTILGTANQITVVNGNGNGNPTISIASDPTLPGTGAVLMPGGTTAQRPGGAAGQVRFNSDTGFMEYYTGFTWANLQAGASIANNLAGGTANQIPVQTGVSQTGFIDAPTVANTFLEWSGSAFQWSANPLGTVTSIDVSGGTTGLTYSGGPITSAGTITMAGTLITTNGGTGLSSYTAGDITFYTAGTALSKLAIGASTFILTSTGTAPQWSDPTSISVNTATNVAGGGANQIVFNTASGTTSFITAPTVANTYLEWSGSAFQWSSNPLGTVTSVDVSGGTTGLTTSGGPVTTSGTITLAGTLAVANGGTGQTSYINGELLIGNTTGNTLTKATLTAGTGITVTNGTGSITIDAINNGTVTSVDASGGTTGMSFSGGPITTSGTLTLSGTLAVANGGTGQTSYVDGELLIGNSSGNTLAKATLTAGTGVSITNGSGAVTIAATNNGTVTSVDVSGGTTGLTTSGGPVTSSGTITLAGTLAVANGGTGETSYTDGELLIGDSTGNTLTKTTLTAGTGISITNGTGSITIATTGAGSVTSVDVSGGTTGLTYSGGPITSTGTITMAGTLITSNGGTGLTSYTAGDLLYYATGTALSALGLGTQGQVLKAGASAPEWGAVDGGTFT